MQDNSTLSERELEILELVATGASNKEIAQKLSISANTVKVHLRNIFAKTGVVSRTEATLYAIREGVVQLESIKASNPAVVEPILAAPEPLSVPGDRSGIPRLDRRSIWVVPAVLLILIAALFSAARQPATPAAASPVIPTAASRWQARAALPAPRTSIAAAVYQNQIYAIGGETSDGISASAIRYRPGDNTWVSLADKPLPVADASAVAVGGKIYVPGGRLTSGENSTHLEVYDPRQDRWEQKAAPPVALSGYGLVALEGRIYLFGGWDGQKAVSSVFEYDPVQDVWQERTPMPTARAFAGAAVAGNHIYVMGGYDGSAALIDNEEYSPEADGELETPWTRRASLPSGRYSMGTASVAGLIFLIGGQGEEKRALLPLEYLPQQDRWQNLETPVASQWTRLALVSTDTQIYAFGGILDGTPTAQNSAYQAVYTIIIPSLR